MSVYSAGHVRGHLDLTQPLVWTVDERILHEATAVRVGEKLVLRTDVLYRGAP